MKRVRNLLSWAPEAILFAQVLFYWYDSSPVNPFAISLVFILVVHFFLNKKSIGTGVAILFIVLNVYMCLALASELSEFSSWNADARSLLQYGLAFLTPGLISSTLMFIKWKKTSLKPLR